MFCVFVFCVCTQYTFISKKTGPGTTSRGGGKRNRASAGTGHGRHGQARAGTGRHGQARGTRHKHTAQTHRQGAHSTHHHSHRHQPPCTPRHRARVHGTRPTQHTPAVGTRRRTEHRPRQRPRRCQGRLTVTRDLRQTRRPQHTGRTAWAQCTRLWTTSQHTGRTGHGALGTGRTATALSCAQLAAHSTRISHGYRTDTSTARTHTTAPQGTAKETKNTRISHTDIAYCTTTVEHHTMHRAH